MMAEYDVIIVGAGASGLAAAYKLLQSNPDYKILILEARDRIGGRLFPVSLKSSNGQEIYDLGGQWVSRNQKFVWKLVESFKLETYDQYTKGKKLMELNSGELFSRNSIAEGAGFFTSLEFFLAVKKIENMCKEVPLKEPEKAPRAKEWDGMTVETFKQQTLWTTSGKRLFDMLIGAIFGMAASQISFLYFLHYCNAAGGFTLLIESENGGGQNTKVKGGLHQVCRLLEHEIGKENILLDHAVTKVHQDEKAVTVTTANGKTFTSKYCILSIDPSLVGKIEFDPALPYERQRLMAQMIVGCYTKFLVTYETPFWRGAGFSGDIARYTDSEEVIATSPVGVVMDATTSDGNAALVGFFTGYAASHWATKSDDEKKKAILMTLKSCFGINAENPLDFAIKDWCNDKWSGGCPVSIITPGGITQFGDIQREPFKRVHWAGTATGTVWRGYVDGAVESGTRAATEIIDRLSN